MTDGAAQAAPAGDAAVATHGLTKLYRGRPALRGINLRVPAGSLFGFLGPNGAGKTTTLRILLGLLRASRGRAEILGRDCWREGARLRRDVGYLPGDIRLYDHLTGREHLRFLAAARGAARRAQWESLALRFELNLEQRVRNYSRGMKQKLGIIQALMDRPQLLILDEPTIALDPLMRQVLYEELRGVAGEGRTVLFSSHTLSEVEALCDRVAILRQGEIVAQDRIEALQHRAVRRVEVRMAAGTQPPQLPAGLNLIERADTWLRATWTGPVQPLLAWLTAARVQDVTLGPPDLEDLFLTYYSDAPRGAQA